MDQPRQGGSISGPKHFALDIAGDGDTHPKDESYQEREHTRPSGATQDMFTLTRNLTSGGTLG